jgi:hypothetical protein
MQFRKVLPTLVFILLMAMAGRAAAQNPVISGSYTSNTLHGEAFGKSWSPKQGLFRVQIDNDNGNRIAIVSGRYVAWNQQAISWLETHYSNNVSITTHSFRMDNGCSSFQAYGGFTTLPSPQVTTLVRQCWYLYPQRPTEIRMATTNPWALTANTNYHGDSYYGESSSTNDDQKFTVDTYWGGFENWHKTYCVFIGNFFPSAC